jgi:aspartate 1-decarboxylase
MQRTMLKSKIRGGKITATELHYEGSVAVDRLLIAAADILPGEQVHVLNVSNGSRIVTYAIAAPEGSGEIALKGAAARLGQVGDEVILLTYAQVDENGTRSFKSRVVHVGRRNRIDSRDKLRRRG